MQQTKKKFKKKTCNKYQKTITFKSDDFKEEYDNWEYKNTFHSEKKEKNLSIINIYFFKCTNGCLYWHFPIAESFNKLIANSYRSTNTKVCGRADAAS